MDKSSGNIACIIQIWTSQKFSVWHFPPKMSESKVHQTLCTEPESSPEENWRLAIAFEEEFISQGSHGGGIMWRQVKNSTNLSKQPKGILQKVQQRNRVFYRKYKKSVDKDTQKIRKRWMKISFEFKRSDISRDVPKKARKKFRNCERSTQ